MTKKLKKDSPRYVAIALWDSDDKRYWQIGKKINPDGDYEEGNIEWRLDKKGRVVKTYDYNEALKLCK